MELASENLKQSFETLKNINKKKYIENIRVTLFNLILIYRALK